MKTSLTWLMATALSLGVVGCYDTEDPGDPRWETGFRAGTVEDDYLSNGERGTITITEVHWSGSVEGSASSHVLHPDDIFIEVRNGHNRPTYLTDWYLYIEAEPADIDMIDIRLHEYDGHFYQVYRIPARENGRPVDPNEYVTIARNRDGAFPNADYYIEDLEIPPGRFEITLRDVDNRLISDAGDTNEDPFAGGYDGMTSRSMERVQLLFSNQGGRNASWHSYAFNTWNPEHAERTVNIAENYRDLTYASPGMPNTPDYSGNTSSGSFE